MPGHLTQCKTQHQSSRKAPNPGQAPAHFLANSSPENLFLPYRFSPPRNALRRGFLAGSNARTFPSNSLLTTLDQLLIVTLQFAEETAYLISYLPEAAMDHVHRILAELSGESRDIALRRALEETARDHLIRLLVHEDYDQIRLWYADDVTMVVGLDTTLDGEILKGHEEIAEHYLNVHEQTEVLMIPVLTIADRGRVTVYTETFYKWLGKVDKESLLDSGCDIEEPVEAPFVGWPAVSHYDVLKVREVVVFDLDDQMKVRRIECRQLGQDNLGQVSMDAQAQMSEKLKVRIQGDI
ncbi:hypothetical protein CkaCkLH20_11584 [Colletotrichum karsti]|uniref:Uncharacterized protein n=1 Tax=Colletotrichum karsti TaxID=1095194 RepID=A0A9P6HTW7_9PEZI|nr:uncharacterized protein CkaCkLH20_11584 [Colletotrichum karsti]KAF9870912.1 hypothetical protein CkaCkLH20_11584 [Colletotrichum karsti]